MKHTGELVPVERFTNRLVATWFDPSTRRYVKQAKRVSANCPMTQEEVRIYVNDGAVKAIKAIQIRLQCDLTEAYNIIKLAKKGRW